MQEPCLDVINSEKGGDERLIKQNRQFYPSIVSSHVHGKNKVLNIFFYLTGLKSADGNRPDRPIGAYGPTYLHQA